MRKLRVAIIALLGTLVCVFASLGIAACNKTPSVATYTVTFVYADDGVTPDSHVTVNEGDTVRKPTPDPTRNGYTFAQWYNGSTQYNFTRSVTSDLTLTAHWTKNGVALNWTANVAIEYVNAGGGSLPTSVETGASVSFRVKQVNPFYTGDIAVTVNGSALDPVDGVYTFTADAAKTIAVSGLTEDTSEMTGNGTETDPYVISTAYQLKTLSDRVNSATTTAGLYGKYFELGADIDYCGYEFTPIGNDLNTEEYYFGDGAQFDGQGYTISNIKFASETNVFGLFGYTFLATIKNVNIDGMKVETEFVEDTPSMIGGIVAYNIGSDVINCSVKGSIVARVNFSGMALHVGSIAGFMSSVEGDVCATVQYCTGEIEIRTNGSEPIYSAGGIVGSAIGADSTSPSVIFNCVANVNMSGEINLAGGIVGQLMLDASVTNCFSQGVVRASDVAGSFTAAGVIAGLAYNDSAIVNCYSFATKIEANNTVDLLETDSTEICGKYFADGFTAIDSHKVLVRNVYKAQYGGIVVGGPTLNSKDTVLQNLKWNESEWEFVDMDGVKIPTVKYVEGADFGVTVNFSGKQVEIENETQPQSSYINALDQYVPVSWIFENMAQSEIPAVDGTLSYGVFFDEDLTIPVPAAYLLTCEETLFVGFADYSVFTGDYQAKFGKSMMEFSFHDDDPGYVYISVNGATARPYLIVYKDADTIRIVEPGFFEDDGDYWATFDRMENTLTISDGVNFGEDGLVAYRVNELVGNWFNTNNDRYEFMFDYTGVMTPRNGGEAQSFTYTLVGTAVEIIIGGQTYTYTYNAATSRLVATSSSSDLVKRAYDAYRGNWEEEYHFKRVISIDGLGRLTYNGVEYDYTINVGTGELEFNVSGVGKVTASFDELGFLVFNGTTVFAEGSYAGTWVDTRYNYAITFNGLGKDSVGVAFDNLGDTFIYESVVQVNSDTGITYRRINMYLYYGENQISYMGGGNLTDDPVYGEVLLIDLPLGTGSSNIRFQLTYYDAFVGDWLVVPRGNNETAFSFNGGGAYSINVSGWSFYGQVTISAKNTNDVRVNYTYANDGKGSFNYNGKSYVMQYVAENGAEAVYIYEGDSNTASFILYRADRYAGMHFIGDSTELYLDGASSSFINLKGTATIVLDGSKDYYPYDVDAAGNVTLYNKTAEQALYLFEVNEDGLFEFKKVTGGAAGETEDTLGQYSVLNYRVWVSSTDEITIIVLDVDVYGEALGMIVYGEYYDVVIFTFDSEDIFIFEWGDTVYSLEYAAGYNAAFMYDLSVPGGELVEMFAVPDDFYGYYTAANGDELFMDGWGETYFGGAAYLVIGDDEAIYEYVISGDGRSATLYSEGGDAEYIVYLDQPSGDATEFSYEDGEGGSYSVWLVEA